MQEIIAPLRFQAGKLAAAFADWPKALAALVPAPALATVPPFRQSSAPALAAPAGRADHWIELPDSLHNVVIRVGTSATQAAQTTIILKLTTLSPAAPIAHGKVLLRDADGLVLFEDLPAGKYRLTVDQANHQWDINVFVGESSQSM